MQKSKMFPVIGAVAAAVLFFGCQSMEEKARVKPAEVSPFLQHPELLVAQKPAFPFHYFYLKKNAGTYKNIYIAPVNTEYLRKNENWAALDEALAKQIGSDIQKLADFMQKVYAEEFSRIEGDNQLKVVDSPDDEKTLVLESAIVAIVPTKAELVVLGTAGNLFLPGIGVLTGHLAAGSVTIECMIKDAKTGEIIAMYANTEQDQKAVLNIAGMTWYTSAENNIRKQADYTARVFSGQDYSVTRRKLIKIVEL